MFDAGGTSQILIAFSVLVSSFLGSLHCMGMCGPIVIALNQNSAQSLLYHFGRLCGYLFLGGIVYWVGREFLGFFPHSLAALIAPLFLGFVFILIGVFLLNKRRFHLGLPEKISAPLNKLIATQTKNKTTLLFFLIGFCSILLPCGWVYGFALSAASSESLQLSMLIMFMFWLGTVPALFFSPAVFQELLKPLKEKSPVISGSVLIVCGCLVCFFAVKRVL